MNAYPAVNVQASAFYFLFPFTCYHKSDAAFGDMVKAIVSTPTSRLVRLPMLPQVLTERVPAVSDPMWQPTDPNLSDDLHRHIALVLGRSDQSVELTPEDGKPSHASYYELSPAARNVLSGRWGQRGSGFEVALSPSALRRLGASTAAPISVRARIEAAHLQLFRSEIGILILECSYRCESGDVQFAEVILEANYQLCRVGAAGSHSLSWAESDDGDTSARNNSTDGGRHHQASFSLDVIAKALVTCGAVEVDLDEDAPPLEFDWMTTTRVFSYCAVQFRHPFVDRTAYRHFAYRLCNKYTKDYSIRSESLESSLVSTFDNVIHGASVEGGCVVVEESGVEFLNTYATNAGRRVYLPLALISFHEFRHLLRLTQESAIHVRQKDTPERQVVKLRELQHDLINFHLFFRFSHASLISVHTLVHQSWRRAFSLDQMLEEVTSDVVEAEKVLSAEAARVEEAAARQKEHRWRTWSTVATWVAAYFALSHGIEIWAHKSLFDPQLQLMTLKVFSKQATVSDFEALQQRLHQTELVLEGFAVLLAIAIAAFVYWKNPGISQKSHGSQ